MKTALALLLAAGGAQAALYTNNTEHQKFMWEEYKIEHNKNYATEDEEIARFGHFIDNLKLIDQRNDEQSTAQHGLNKFTDLSAEEFRAMYLMPGYKQGPIDQVADETNLIPDEAAGLIDWTGKLTTPVKNQEQCGSCWAFSATEQIESDAMRTLGDSYVLSPQQTVSCDKVDLGCNGGNTETAYNYVKKAGGLVLNKDYPYTSGTGVTGSCLKKKTQDKKVTVTGYTTVKSEKAMAAYVQKTGPLSICVDADNGWQTYTGGILSTCGKQVDHCVQAVGIDMNNGYWKVRNSWGTSWGENGFIRLKYGKNMCDLTNDPTWVKVKNV